MIKEKGINPDGGTILILGVGRDNINRLCDGLTKALPALDGEKGLGDGF